MLRLRMIAATTKKGGIGFRGTIPWDYPEDLKRFRSITKGYPVIMGRNTWESLPIKPLPGRTNIVITTKPEDLSGVYRTTTPTSAVMVANEVLSREEDENRIAWIIGGQSIYEAFIHNPLLDFIDLTIIPDDYDCDTFFPLIPSRFILSNTKTNRSLIHQQYQLHETFPLTSALEYGSEMTEIEDGSIHTPSQSYSVREFANTFHEDPK